MNLKTAASLAMISMLLLTILLAADFLWTLSGVLNNILPAMAIVRSFIYLFASLSVTLFFWFFSRAESR